MNEQLIQKAKTAKSAEELHTLAKAEGMEMTMEEAATAFHKLNPPLGTLTDEELENVAGGGCGGSGSSAPAPQEFNRDDVVSVIGGGYLLRCNYDFDPITKKAYKPFFKSGVAGVCQDPSCCNVLYSVWEYDSYSAPGNDPNHPDAVYSINCTQCNRACKVFKKYLHRS